jgi:lipid II:glycine glycyltransferase (peptidoglycan interpeptide bridge formation enzyme)
MNQTDHPLQSPAWAAFRKKMKIDVVVQNDWIITFHKIPYTPWCIGYFPKGPLPDESMIKALTNIGKQKNALYIQLEPNVEKNSQITVDSSQLKQSHHPFFTKHTFILDLTKSEDDLLRAMQPKTRYNIKVAQKHGVIVREDNSPEAFAAYLKLEHETTSRQGYYAHNDTYHTIMWETMHAAGIAHLFTAVYQEKILAAWIIFVWHDTAYYPYGASSRDHRETMAPTLMLWEIAKWAKQKGLKKFDLWGAMGPTPTGEPDTNDPWYGFHRFKQGFNPALVEFVGSYDLVIQPFLYSLFKIADKLRWFILKKHA